SAAAIASDGLIEDRGRPTTEKVRVVTERNQQVARVDYEADTDAAEDVQRAVVDRLGRYGGTAKAILVSDYLKGTITRPVVEALLSVVRSVKVSADRSDIAIIIDPKVPHLDRYDGATLVTPNHLEAEAATQRMIRT